MAKKMKKEIIAQGYVAVTDSPTGLWSVVSLPYGFAETEKEALLKTKNKPDWIKKENIIIVPAQKVKTTYDNLIEAGFNAEDIHNMSDEEVSEWTNTGHIEIEYNNFPKK